MSFMFSHSSNRQMLIVAVMKVGDKMIAYMVFKCFSKKCLNTFIAGAILPILNIVINKPPHPNNEHSSSKLLGYQLVYNYV